VSHGNQLSGPIPAALANLTWLAGSDLRWNALYTSDAALRAFLNTRQIGGDCPAACPHYSPPSFSTQDLCRTQPPTQYWFQLSHAAGG
jgi:hypothetical protein